MGVSTFRVTGVVLTLIIGGTYFAIQHACAPDKPTKAAGQESIAQWTASLKDSDPSRRSSTLYEIGKLGPKASAAVPLVIRSLQSDPDPLNRQTAAHTLGEMGPRAKDAVPALIHAVEKDREAGVRGAAANALGYLAGEAGPAIPALIRALDDKTGYGHADGPVTICFSPCADAACALGRLKASDAVPALTRLLDDGEASIIHAAADALGEMGPEASSAVPALVKLLENPSRLPDRSAETVRVSAVDALARIGPSAAEAVPALLAMLKAGGKDDRAGTLSLSALRSIGHMPEDAIPLLMAGLDDPREEIHYAGTLVSFGEQLTPYILEDLKSQDIKTRLRAARLVWLMRGKGAGTASALGEALRSSDDDLRHAAILALDELGPAAKPAEPALLESLASPSKSIRYGAASVLTKIDPTNPKPVATLVGLLDDKQWRLFALESLGDMGPAAASAAPAVGRYLTDDDEHTQFRAAVTLWQVGKREAAMPRLVAGLDNANAAYWVGRIGPSAEPLVPHLIALLSNTSSSVRLHSALALDKIGPGAKAAVPPLILLLDDEDATVGYAAAGALGSIGQDARAAIPALEEAACVSDFQMRRAAEHAIRQITGQGGASRSR